MGRIIIYRKYEIDVTGLDPLYLGELGGSSSLVGSVLLDVLIQ